MGDCKWRLFQGTESLWAVRWYCKYSISYRNLKEMLEERPGENDYTTTYRCVQHSAPEMETRLRWYWKRPGFCRSWQVDTTYVKVKGKWIYLCRAVDKDGDTIIFYLSATRNTKTAKRFLGAARNGLREWQTPSQINTEKAPTCAPAIAELEMEGKLPSPSPSVSTAMAAARVLGMTVGASEAKISWLDFPA